MSCFDCCFYAKEGCAVNPDYCRNALQRSATDCKNQQIGESLGIQINPCDSLNEIPF